MANALLLAGGLGTRLRPLTETTPKCLVEIGGVPLLSYWIDALAAAGVSRAVINTHHLAVRVRDEIARINETGRLRLEESYEPELLGSAGTIGQNRHLADDADEVIVIYADNLSDLDLAALLRFHRSHAMPVTTVLFHAPDPAACGIATLDSSGTIVDFIEKPSQPRSDLANAGVYVFDSSEYERVADMAAFDLGFDVLPGLVGKMKGFIHEGYHRDIGSLPALAAAERDVLSGLGPRRISR